MYITNYMLIIMLRMYIHVLMTYVHSYIASYVAHMIMLAYNYLTQYREITFTIGGQEATLI